MKSLAALEIRNLTTVLGLILMVFACLRITAETRLALRLDELAETGDGELPIFLCFFHGGFGEKVEESTDLLVAELCLFCHCPYKGCFRHSFCHVFLLAVSRVLESVYGFRSVGAPSLKSQNIKDYAGSTYLTAIHLRLFGTACQPELPVIAGFFRYSPVHCEDLRHKAANPVRTALSPCPGMRTPSHLEERPAATGSQWFIEEADDGCGGAEPVEDSLIQGGLGGELGG